MVNDGFKWDGLLKWSLAHADGTGSARHLSEEDRRWFMEAMQAQTVDVVKRMKEITLVMKTPEEVLQAQGVSPSDLEEMFDELQEHVESIDMANDLHSIGGLVPLLGYLKNSNAGIRAKTAEVVTTIVQNNPRSQQLVMDANGMEPLLSNFSSDPDITVRTKALGAISSLIRHNKPGLTAFRLALNLIQYLVHESESDRGLVSELGLPRQMVHLAASDDKDVREAALRGLLELARDERATAAALLLAEEEKLRQVLEGRVRGIGEMGPEDLGAAREERQLVDALWAACFGEPSSLREKGLVALPGEDDEPSPPPDVAGQLLEPPLRAWAAKQQQQQPPPAPADGESSAGGKKAAPLLLGPRVETDIPKRDPQRTDRWIAFNQPLQTSSLEITIFMRAHERPVFSRFVT
ncbi:unnamed protein product [Spirodela intermedia]|uniref:TOG domain-containing protein n=1 Tax=Spirodela intermedia TaxID=51605 RepID=A0A7I8JIP1_SPIIN|nr:unnamed protein product [Spirodela intermedia]CAA6669393.1 unnamed protein product [Spirodela intermedia]